jgi:hypothetical protein
MNQAVDRVRRAESKRLGAKSKPAAQSLKNMRSSLLRRGSRVRGHARQKLDALLAGKLATAKKAGNLNCSGVESRLDQSWRYVAARMVNSSRIIWVLSASHPV